MMQDGQRWRTSPEIWAKLKPYARENRAQATPAENRLWQALRGNRLGVKFRRQHVVGPHIADFYCARPGLIIEVDGSSHDGRNADDAERRMYFESLGTPVMRFTNDQVLRDTAAVLRTITSFLERVDSPSPPGGEGGQGVRSDRLTT